MKKILGLAIVLVLFAGVADATQAVRQKYTVNSSGLMAAAKSSLSPEGVEQLHKILAKEANGEQPVFYTAVFFELALRHDLMKDDVKKVKKFLKLISDRRLVTCTVSGGTGKFKGRGKYRVNYSLDIETPSGSDQNTKAAPAESRKNISPSGNVYYLVVDQSRPGEKSGYGSWKMPVRLPR